MLAAALLDEIDGGAGASAGREHRIEQDDEALIDVLGQLAVVFVRLERFMIAVKSDMPDLCGGDEGVDTVDHAETGAEDRDDSKLLAGDDGSHRFRDWGFNRDQLGRQIAKRFIAHQGGYLLDQLAELHIAGIYVAQQSDLVRNKRMIEDYRIFVQHFSFVPSLYFL